MPSHPLTFHYQWTYDAAGNRVSTVHPEDGTLLWTADSANRYVAVGNGDPLPAGLPQMVFSTSPRMPQTGAHFREYEAPLCRRIFIFIESDIELPLAFPNSALARSTALSTLPNIFSPVRERVAGGRGIAGRRNKVLPDQGQKNAEMGRGFVGKIFAQIIFGAHFPNSG